VLNVHCGLCLAQCVFAATMHVSRECLLSVVIKFAEYCCSSAVSGTPARLLPTRHPSQTRFQGEWVCAVSGTPPEAGRQAGIVDFITQLKSNHPR
jgi:hypothetical protein